MSNFEQQTNTETTQKDLQIPQIENKNPSDLTPDELTTYVSSVRHEHIQNPELKQSETQAGLALIQEFADKPEYQTILNNIVTKTDYPLSALCNKLTNGKSVFKDYLDYAEKLISPLSRDLKSPDTNKQNKAL